MKTSNIIGILLLGSLALNVYFYLDRGASEPECPAEPGFEVPVELTEDEAIMYTDNFKNILESNDTIEGGIVTRSAFEEMMCNPGCNAISYSFAIDPSGEVGPPDGGIFVVFAGVKATENPETGALIIDKTGSKYYYTRRWCPPSCLKFR